jgi:hypothetical protein
MELRAKLHPFNFKARVIWGYCSLLGPTLRVTHLPETDCKGSVSFLQGRCLRIQSMVENSSCLLSSWLPQTNHSSVCNSCLFSRGKSKGVHKNAWCKGSLRGPENTGLSHHSQQSSEETFPGSVKIAQGQAGYMAQEIECTRPGGSETSTRQIVQREPIWKNLKHKRLVEWLKEYSACLASMRSWVQTLEPSKNKTQPSPHFLLLFFTY